MDLFTEIEDAVAIVRLPKGVHKQTKMFARGRTVYIPHGGGFVRLVTLFGSEFSTSHPSIKVLEFEANGVTVDAGVPVFRAPMKAAA